LPTDFEFKQIEKELVSCVARNKLTPRDALHSSVVKLSNLSKVKSSRISITLPWCWYEYYSEC